MITLNNGSVIEAHPSCNFTDEQWSQIKQDDQDNLQAQRAEYKRRSQVSQMSVQPQLAIQPQMGTQMQMVPVTYVQQDQGGGSVGSGGRPRPEAGKPESG